MARARAAAAGLRAAFWTVFSVPGPVGALVLTACGERVGAQLALAALAWVSPVRGTR